MSLSVSKVPPGRRDLLHRRPPFDRQGRAERVAVGFEPATVHVDIDWVETVDRHVLAVGGPITGPSVVRWPAAATITCASPGSSNGIACSKRTAPRRTRRIACRG